MIGMKVRKQQEVSHTQQQTSAKTKTKPYNIFFWVFHRPEQATEFLREVRLSISEFKDVAMSWDWVCDLHVEAGQGMSY